MPADEDGGAGAHAQFHLGDLGMPVGRGVRFVEQAHGFHAHRARVEHPLHQLTGGEGVVRRCQQRLLHEGEQPVVRLLQDVGMLGVGRQPLEPVDNQLPQRADVGVEAGVSHDAYLLALQRQDSRSVALGRPSRHLGMGALTFPGLMPSAGGLRLRLERVTALHRLTDEGREAGGVEIDVGDGGKERLPHEPVGLWVRHLVGAGLLAPVGDPLEQPDEQVLQLGHLRVLAADAAHRAGFVPGRFLTLIAEHRHRVTSLNNL